MTRAFDPIAIAVCIAFVCDTAVQLSASPIIFVGLGGQTGISTNNGAIGILDPATGAVTVIGTPMPEHSISGLTFTSNGNLWGSTQIGGGLPPTSGNPPPTTTSDLIQINPVTGAEISSVLINADGTPVSIADLATQPGTNEIFGIQSPNDANFTGTANLYTISTAGAATLVGSTGVFFGSIAFAPNGTLYMTSADLPTTVGNCADGGDINCALSTLNPANAATITTVATPDFYSALGISPTGVIWGGNGGGDIGGAGIGQFYPGVSILDPTTGNATFIGNTGTNFAGDIAFAPVPEVASLVLSGLGLAVLLALKCRRS